jgi:hypothetical protein
MLKRLTWLLPAAALALALALSGSVRAVDDVTLLVIVHPRVRLNELSADQLEAIFTMSVREWPGGEPTVPYNYVPGSPYRERFDRAALRMAPEEVARFWIDRRIRGMGDAPRKVPTVALMLRVVANLPGAIGYVPEGPLPPDVKLVARIVGGRVLHVGAR